jgi:hypothetical protein
MQLKDLFQNFTSQNDEGQRTMVANYRARRAKEFEDDRIAYQNKKTKKKKAPKVQLTDEEKALMKLLGLKAKDIQALRASNTDEEN